MEVPQPYSDPVQVLQNHAYLEEGPAAAPLQVLDEELAEHSTSLTLEIAEDTYAALLNNRPQRDKMTVYTPQSLPDIQKETPGSTFWKFDGYEKDKYYDMAEGDAFIRLRFEREHAETVPVETGYEHIAFRLPTYEAFEANMEELGYEKSFYLALLKLLKVDGNTMLNTEGASSRRNAFFSKFNTCTTDD